MNKISTEYQVHLETKNVTEQQEAGRHTPNGSEKIQLNDNPHDFQHNPLLLSYRNPVLIPESAQSICFLSPHL